MMSGLLRRKQAPGWFTTSMNQDALDFAHGSRTSSGRASINAWGSRPLDGEKNGLQKAAQELHLERYQCATLLSPGDYQMLLLEAPKVPKPELKAAMRWRIKD